ncbi:hypothetical protein [Mesomycoplasma ovipneumoniae]|uniref:hypothetical protein n=1 Tax=Mesomycoplasma ovipneumoniae TaxID=29562 RepID=UPI002963F3A3|nr:hypothetical protein [Mesomycoplasma ovipneumoniae]MDW2923679.1 hypothetical protein [Mesomycoplasma ovipneumoniae]
MLTFSLKSKLKYLLILGLSSPLFLISCIDPYTEVRKNITETLLPKGSKSSVNTQGKEQDKTEQTISVPGSELNQTYSEVINDSLLGFNGIKKNPKNPQNLYSRDKNYVTEIGDASFISSPNNKYGLSNYWFYYKSLPFMLEDSNIKAGSSNFKDEYYKRLSYLEEKLKKYTWENLGEYNSNKNFSAWDKIMQDFNEKTGLKDKNAGFDQTVSFKYPETDEYWPIVQKELPPEERENKTYVQKQMLVHDFMFGNAFASPRHMDLYRKSEKLVSDKTERIWNYIRYFRDDYYRETNYKPSPTERHWYSLLELIQRIQRNYNGQYAAAELMKSLSKLEQRLFNINDKTKSLKEQIENNLKSVFKDLFEIYQIFFLPDSHTSLRKDLVFNIDLGQNVDMQSLAADLIKVYNSKIAPLIWKYNSEASDTEKIEPLKNWLDNVFLDEYVYPLMGGLKFVELDEKKTEDGKDNPISLRKWEEWKDNYKEFYGWEYKESILSHPASKNIDSSSNDSSYSSSESSSTSSNSSGSSSSESNQDNNPEIVGSASTSN